jgi:hydrogenase nickel incorporation protein HypA/HybF
MHELSVAQSIVDIIQVHVPEAELANVRTVRLKIGSVAGIVQDSLEFSFGVITAGTPLAHTALTIETIPFTVKCNQCGKESLNEQGIILCSYCGSSDTTVVAGTELQIGSIELDDPRESGVV